MKLRIGPYQYDVVSVSGIEHRRKKVVGLLDADQQTIYVDADLPRERWLATLWHEVVHAIDDDRAIGLTERQVEALANGIVQFGKDNTEVLSWE